MYISVRNWRKFQHYDPEKRAPIWIKTYLELAGDDGYVELSTHRRGVLHAIWIMYAVTRCELRVDLTSEGRGGDVAVTSARRGRNMKTPWWARRMNVKVTLADLEALNHAGFIDFVDSKELADGYQAASTMLALEVEVEVDEDIPLPPSSENPRSNPRANGRASGRGAAFTLAEALIRNGGYQLTDASLLDELHDRHVPEIDHEPLLELARSLRP